MSQSIRPFAPLTPTERFRMLSAQPFVRLCAGIACVALVVGYFLVNQSSRESHNRQEMISAATFSQQLPTSSVVSFKVYVTGEVNSPGVIAVESHARIADAISKAGGPTPNADITHCNLAAFVSDGATIDVPSKAGISGLCGGAVPTPIAGSDSNASSQGKININTATQSEIETLPGVGPTLGAAIISYRTHHGSFTSVADLQKVKGIGKGRFEDLKDLVTV